MKAKDKDRYVNQARTLFSSLDPDKLIGNPDDASSVQAINRLIAIFKNFSSNDGDKLEKLFKEFQKWARTGKRAPHIKNCLNDVLQFIGQKIEEIDVYIIKDETSKVSHEGKSDDKERFDVALSFAGEQRDYVEKVALYLEREGGLRVFYDYNYEVEMWGNNMLDYFKKVFEKRADYCVMFISKEYTTKTWPNFERQIIQAKSLFQEGYLLPARFDDAILEGEIPTVKYVDISSMSPEDFGELVIKKVVGSDRYSSKKKEKTVTITNEASIATPEKVPLLYIKPNISQSGGSSGHFLNFTFKNMSDQVLFDIRWGMRGFDYEWRPGDDFFELEPGGERELTFSLSGEKIFQEETLELNVFAEYKNMSGQHFFVRRELRQEKVPSGAFYAFKAAAFHEPSLLKDDGLKLLTEPNAVGDRYEAIFEIHTPQGLQKARIGISRTFLSVWGLVDDGRAAHAVVELGHRQMRKMAREGNVQDYVFVTTDYSQEYQDGFEGYKKLRDTI